MKTFSTTEKRSPPATHKTHPYIHRSMGPVQRTQQVAMRKILRPDETETGEPEDTHQPQTTPVPAVSPSALPSSRPAIGAGITTSLQRSENETPEEEIQRQPDEEEEEPIQARLIQRQTDDEEEEEAIQPEAVQRKTTDTHAIQPSKFGFVGPEAKARQTAIRRILRPTGLQTKLTVGQPNDKYEQEADKVADQVEAMPDPRLQRQSEDEEEEEALQPKPLANQITPLVQRQEVEEEEELQTKREVPERIQAKGTPDLSEDVEQATQQMRGHGDPLPRGVRQETENKMGADFSAVRIHNNNAANEINRQINARAFTLGNDIFFASGAYSPATHTGKRLLAHELTHVVQQSGSTDPQRIRRDDTPDTASDDTNDSTPQTNTESEYDGPEGTASTVGSRINIREIHFPAIPEKEAKTGSQNVQIRQGSVERNTNQVQVWSELTREGTGLSDSLDEKTRAAWHSGSESNPTYFMKIGSRSSSYLVGTRTNIRNRVIRPYWTGAGRMKTYDVDHKKEYQLGGHDRSPADNLWLLESRTNRSSGSRINSKINQSLDRLLARWASSRKPDRETARNTYTVTLNRIHWDGPVEGTGESYSVEEISENVPQMGPVVPMNRRAVQRAGLDPGEGQFVVFNNATGGRARSISLPSSTGDAVPFSDPSFIAGFRPTTATFVGDDSNYIEISGTLWADNPAIQGHGFPTSFNISRMTNLPQAGYLNVTRAEAKIRQVFAGDIEASALSPLRLTSVGMDELGAPLVEGTVDTNISFLEGADIGFFIRGNDLGIEKTFTSSDLNIPRPFEIEEAALTVSLSTQRGLAAEGNVAFKIDGVGEGSVTANVGTSQDFALSGSFDFDERIFGEGTQAQVRIGYANNQWSMGGTLSIPRGRVPGVDSATINVDYSEEEGFRASGEAELAVPGVESGRLEIAHSEESGFSIGGEFGLSSDVPGIRSGSISAEVREKEDGSGYAVSATGTAVPDIPGINSNLTISYDDGAFTAEVTAQYERGMLSGELEAGVTNRSVNAETGELSDTAEENNPLVVYGGGSLTLQIAPWLQGTAGVRFAPNGEITVTGEIGLPDQLEIFARREINRSILNIAVQAPIFPGIVAEIGGGLSATAGIGPGVIDELRLGVEYNPDREQDTRVTGDAHLNIPADAGLRLSVRAGIGLGITGASATGGLEIGGTLGIQGAAEAGVHVEWSPAEGLDLRANVGIHAQPNFTFDISGYVSVRALGFSVYDQRWELASFTFGSDYRFGISLPIHYREGQPFDISLEDVEFEVPNIDTNELLQGLISRIA